MNTHLLPTVFFSLLLFQPVVGAVGTTTRVSVDSDGLEVDGASFRPAVSADGRYVAFASSATNLVPGDTNGRDDVFVHDRQTRQTTRVSVASNGTQASADSGLPAISADGRYVAFASVATTLVPGDTNGVGDIFVHDRQTRQTTRVSLRSNGAQANGSSGNPSLSANGRFVAFSSYATNLVSGDTNSQVDVFVHDRQTRRTTRISLRSNGTQANRYSYNPALSADSRFVAFTSAATNLVPGDTNGDQDIFVHDRQTRQTTRVSVRSNGAQANGQSDAPALSADGRYIGFTSEATNLVSQDTNGYRDIFLRDRLLDNTTTADFGFRTASASPILIEPGNVITYRFTVSNQGPQPATGATLVDALSSQLIVNTVSPSRGQCTKAHVLVCRLGNLASGARATVTVKARVRSSAPAGTFLQNTVSVAANPRDRNLGNNRGVLGTSVAR